MSDAVSRLQVRRFGRAELLELARWEAVSTRHGWSVGDGTMSVDVDEDGGEYVPVYLAAVAGGPVYFIKPGAGAWSVVNGRGQATRHRSLRSALEYICPTHASTHASRSVSPERPGAVVVHLPTAASHLRVVR